MKKIMFNDRFGLTQAVLDGRKTMTRRIIGNVEKIDSHFDIDDRLIGDVFEVSQYVGTVKSTYHIGEEVAIAQSYEAIGLTFISPPDTQWGCTYEMQGYSNKMFVRADLMPHRIRITNIKLEQLQDISEEDAMREGVFKYDKPPLHHECDMFAPWPPYIKPYKWDADNLIYRCNARYAFAYLIDKVSGAGTWKRNPWVFAYEFELV